MTFKLCEILISIGRTDGLADKLDVFFAANRLTYDEYIRLIWELEQKTGKDEGKEDTEDEAGTDAETVEP